MTHDGETMDVTTSLAAVRNDMVRAIAADRRQSRRRRRTRLAAVAVAAALAAVGTGVAATTGFLSPAPDAVRAIFNAVDGGADGAKAVRIGVIDDHAAYAAPTAGGGFCLHFAPNPRSGPSGTPCTVRGSLAPDEIVLAPELGHDGGFVVGRVGTAAAATVAVALPGGGTVTAPVVEDRFFLAGLPAAAMDALAAGATLSATAADARGTIVARSRPELAQWLAQGPASTDAVAVSPPAP